MKLDFGVLWNMKRTKLLLSMSLDATHTENRVALIFASSCIKSFKTSTV